MNPQSRMLWSSVAAVLLATVGWWVSSGEGAQVSGTSAESAIAPSTPELALESRAVYAPCRRVPLPLPALDGGIPLGDGSFLPPLNGVKVRDGIPPIRRDPRLPPPGPVVAKQTDDTGQEWWVHADGSLTSCCYASVTLANGEDRVIVSTQHGAVVPGSHGTLRRR